MNTRISNGVNKQNDTVKAGVCAACVCPCDAHKKHAHDTKDGKDLEETCKTCGGNGDRDQKRGSSCCM